MKEDENFFSEIKLPTAQGDGLMWAWQTFSPGLTSGKFQTAAMEPSRAILMLVSGGTIVLSWLATLAIPFLNLFCITTCYSGLEWYMKFLLNVSPAVSTTSTFLIISATSILAVCNR